MPQVHRGEGGAGRVVDGEVQELSPGSLDAVAAVARDPVRGPLDTYQALDIEVQHVAGSGAFVAVGR